MADPLDLDALEALAAEALEHGPWRIRNDDRGDGWVVAIEPEGGVRGVTFWAEHADDAGLDVLPDDAAYIVAACNSVPALVAEVRRLRAANKELHKELKEAVRDAYTEGRWSEREEGGSP